ncbi:hypothetical protein [Pseudomonas sp.]|uniref:hypothetical protein n=1 Tax=Pseudomonas sp. TaxID=306 RepID=UPI00356A478F
MLGQKRLHRTSGDALQMGSHFVLRQVVPGVRPVLENQRTEVIDIPLLCLAYFEVAHPSSLFHEAIDPMAICKVCKNVARRGAP